MKIYQYRSGYYTGKLHVVIRSKFLCGASFASWVDVNDPDDINFSKGICKSCQRLYKSNQKRYSKDLNFEVIKLKLGVK